MPEEQVLDTTIQKAEVEGSDTTIKEEPSPEIPETVSMDEYKKAIQSSASKAKFEILKELGIANVKEFHDLKTTYEQAISGKSDLETQIKNLNDEKQSLEEDLMLTKLGVSEEFKKDILTLAKSKVDENHSLSDVSKELLEKYPQWKSVKETIKIGTERSDVKDAPEISQELLNRFPWLKD